MLFSKVELLWIPNKNKLGQCETLWSDEVSVKACVINEHNTLQDNVGNGEATKILLRNPNEVKIKVLLKLSKTEVRKTITSKKIGVADNNVYGACSKEAV